MKPKLTLLSSWAFALLLIAVPIAHAATTTVKMNNFSFTPSTVTIAQGDTITWTNTGGTHTTTSGSPPGTADGLWNSGTTTNTVSFSFTFSNTVPQTYPYFCTFHYSAFNMIGSVIVTSAPPSGFVVTAQDFLFTPANLTIGQGDTVIWTNIGGIHTTTSGTVPAGSGSPDGLWDGSLPASGASFSMTFSNYAPRTYSYYCTFHASLSMIGSLTVTSSVAPPLPILTSAKMPGPAQFGLTINGLVGQQYAILYSPDLLSWSPVSTNLALSTSHSISNLPVANPSSGYYRAQEIP
jgi:plastocyanin